MVNGNAGSLLSVSDSALNRFLKIMRDNSIPDGYSLRITVEGDKLSGITYKLGFDSSPKDSDISIPLSGLTILIDPESAPVINGTFIDFKEEGCCGGFVFHNPNSADKCGCHN